MLLSELPPSLSDWSRSLSHAPWWQLHSAALHPVSAPLSAGWLVLFGRSLQVAHLAKLADTLTGLGVVATLYPTTEVAEVPLLLLGTDTFSDELVAQLKREQWDIDICHLPALPTLNEPGLLVMDMDSTAIQIECIDEIARLAGVGEQVAAVTAAAMQGKLEFAASLRNRVALLAGAPVTILDEVAANMPWMPGLPLMVKTLKQAGWKVAIASGGFTRFAGQLQQALGLDAVFANELVVDGDTLTGQVHGRIVDAAVKAEVLQQLAQQYGIAASQTVAVGDGANDLNMMAVAGLGIAIHAKPLVQAQAAATLNHHDLEGVLCLIGASACRDRRWDMARS
ncbi:phosphoserine phosphatase SerB [Aeromonas cavernicola]|uniref:Phosphoserine phosphatase n=1 Tax=Aeromonas cavernicola TaxID=1006623 RepID=A0A2H9U2I5_9GAMM|nr:phosphoserine phosphatase SerB [Aeromonas cavernicola]PJG58262.1 phosphoserine phosphatase SerB [Aeromonas cavernicola]